MDYKRIAKFVAVTFFLLLFGAVMAQLAPTEASNAEMQNKLSELHSEEEQVELQISEKKESKMLKQAEVYRLDAELDDLRVRRTELVEQRNDIINSTAEKPPPFGEASVESNINFAVVEDFNISKLAYAIAMAETGDCTTGMGVTRNNCFGIMTWKRGFREGKTYSSKDESYADFRRVWEKSYGGFPTRSMARKWTGNDSPSNWLSTVKLYYSK